MILVLAAVLLWLGINLAVVLMDLVLVLFDDRAERRVAGLAASPRAGSLPHR